MFELLIEQLSTKTSYRKVKFLLSLFDTNIKVSACLEDRLIWIKSNIPLRSLCAYLQSKGLEVSGASHIKDSQLEKILETHHISNLG